MTPNFLAQFGSDQRSSFVDRLNRQSSVFLIYARHRGEQVFYYLQVPDHQKEKLRQKLKLGKRFKPSHEGMILACGRGIPSPALSLRMRDEYGV